MKEMLDCSERVCSLLVTTAKGDPYYADLYLERARTVLAVRLPASEYRRLREASAVLSALTAESRAVIQRGEWSRLLPLVGRMREIRLTLQAGTSLLRLGGEVYDAEVSVDLLSPGLDAAFPMARRERERLRQSILATLGALERDDPDRRAFYSRRRGEIERFPVHAAPWGFEGNRSVEVAGAALAALDRGDLDELEHLAGQEPGSRKAGDEPLHSLRMTEMAAEPLPAAAADRGRRLGLRAMRVEAVVPAGDYLGCCCAWRATLPDRPLGTVRPVVAGCSCRHVCPPGVAPALRETLDLLMAYPFVNSAGARYLPSFAEEHALVEDFPDSADRGEVSPLLTRLGLATRRGLPRRALDATLLERGPGVLRDDLGVDPRDFRLVCIPFDLYCRLASALGWAQDEKLWTHFDGYQIWKQGRLRPLAGGDPRFGGPYHVLSIGRDDSRSDVLARFAVVRRERFRAPALT